MALFIADFVKTLCLTYWGFLHLDSWLKDLSLGSSSHGAACWSDSRSVSLSHNWLTHSSLPLLTAAWGSVEDIAKGKRVTKTNLIPLLKSLLLSQGWHCNTNGVCLSYFGLALFIIKSIHQSDWWREYSSHVIPCLSCLIIKHLLPTWLN